MPLPFLLSLHIINFAIIKDTVLDPASGVTICTGETGSGKSIVIDALAVLMGRRAKTDCRRYRSLPSEDLR